jgi:hypothetical protein
VFSVLSLSIFKQNKLGARGNLLVVE